MIVSSIIGIAMSVGLALGLMKLFSLDLRVTLLIMSGTMFLFVSLSVLDFYFVVIPLLLLGVLIYFQFAGGKK